MHRDKYCGHHDWLVSVVLATGWTPEVISQQDPQFLDELLAAYNGRTRYLNEGTPGGK